MNKTVAAAVLHVKEGEQTVQKINELVEQTTVVPEQFPQVKSKMEELCGVHTLLTNLTRAQGSSPQVAEVTPKLEAAAEQLLAWVYKVLCSSAKDVLDNLAKHVEQKVTLSLGAKTSEAAQSYLTLAPQSILPAPALSAEFKLLCSLPSRLSQFAMLPLQFHISSIALLYCINCIVSAASYGPLNCLRLLRGKGQFSPDKCRLQLSI